MVGSNGKGVKGFPFFNTYANSDGEKCTTSEKGWGGNCDGFSFTIWKVSGAAAMCKGSKVGTLGDVDCEKQDLALSALD